jgi:pimeloyl-ACP methyl ester carboxylesterase
MPHPRPSHFPLPTPRDRLTPRSRDGVHLNVEVHGPEDAPTVVLIHGWTCSIPFWAPVISLLSQDLRVVAYDQRGHGASDTPGQGHYSVQALVDDLTTVLDAALPDGQKAVLAGHSMGGMTIMASAFRQSTIDRTTGALLASTGFTSLAAESRLFPRITKPAPRNTRAAHFLLTSRIPLGPVTPFARGALKYVSLGPDADKSLAAYNAEIVHACRPAPRSAWGHVLNGVELADAVRELDVPTKVLVGTSDRLTPPPHAHRLVETLPQCLGLTELPGVGHMTPLEAPDTVATLIRSLLTPASPAPAATPVPDPTPETSPAPSTPSSTSPSA